MSEQKTLRKFSELEFLPMHRTWAEIDLSALRHNYALLTSKVKQDSPHCRPICVVKADAYGHGMSACVSALIGAGADFFAVSSLEEAMALKGVARGEGKDVRVLILGYTLPSQVSLLIENNITQTVFSYEYALALAGEAEKTGGVLDVHVKLDTGMNRLGFGTWDSKFDDTLDKICEIVSFGCFSVRGIFTHFARADEIGAPMTELQEKRYFRMLDALSARGISFSEKHMCNSALTLTKKECLLDMARLGILLYGLSPSNEVGLDGLIPVMRLKTVVSHIHTLEPGETVSYGGHFSAHEPRVLATLPIGYADGFVRACTGGYVKIGEGRAKIVGNICMDQCMADITDLSGVKVGDVVTVYGEDGESIERFASLAGTINYELVCLVSGRVPRIILE